MAMTRAEQFLSQLNEESVKAFADLARKCDSVEEFIRKTDGMDVLYRGSYDDNSLHNVFMTDYVGHAYEYAGDEGKVDAYMFNPEDVLYYNDNRFDRFEELRDSYKDFSDQQLKKIYQDALSNNRHASEFRGQFSTLKKLLKSNIPYSDICGYPAKNDILVPLLQKYAKDTYGKNIIAFLGSDYGDYGGQTEYVVADATRLTNLRKIYASAHGEPDDQSKRFS
jgi:hypothetical protein